MRVWRNAWLRASGDGCSPIDAPPVPQPEFWGIGHALIGTGRDYLRFLRMLLNRGMLDGRRILSEPMVDALLANQIGAHRLGPMPSTDPAASATVARPGTAQPQPARRPRRGGDPGPPRRRRPGLGRALQHPLVARPGAQTRRPVPDPDAALLRSRASMAAFEAFERAVHDV